MRVSDIFVQGGGDYDHDKDGRYSFGGYYGSKGRRGYGYYNGYNRGYDRCCRHDDDDDGLLSILD